jgi:cytochrome c oxidase cbb3-type subunit 4
MTMDAEVIRGIGTLVLMLAFLALCWWAYSPANRRRFEEDARLPFRDDADDTSGGGHR